MRSRLERRAMGITSIIFNGEGRGALALLGDVLDVQNPWFAIVACFGTV
jgi:hypothetical protein